MTSLLDIVPTHFFRRVFDSVGTWIDLFVNKSLLSGYIPAFCKQAMVRPVLKMANLDLPFISKILEKNIPAPTKFPGHKQYS